MNKLDKARASNAAYQVSRSSAILGFSKLFTIYGCKSHLAHVTQILQTFFPSPHGGSTCNLIFISPAVLEKISFEKADDANADADYGLVYPISSPGAFGSGELKIFSGYPSYLFSLEIQKKNKQCRVL